MSRSEFIKFYGFPIPVTTEPHFSYFVDLYESHYVTLTKWNNFKKEMNFISNATDLRNKIIQDIEENAAYKKFAACDMQDWQPDKALFESLHLSKSLYSLSNCGQYYVSIDLKEANFSSLRYFDPEIVQNANNYHEFMMLYTNEEILTTSKKFRQVIFGHLLPRKQQIVQAKIMENIMKGLLKEGVVNENQLKVHNNDEIIFQCDSPKDSYAKLLAAKDFLFKHFNALRFNLHAYRLDPVATKTGKNIGFKRVYVLNEQGLMNEQYAWELKCVPSFLYAQVYKHEAGCKITKEDCVFTHNDIICYASNIFEDSEESQALMIEE